MEALLGIEVPSGAVVLVMFEEEQIHVGRFNHGTVNTDGFFVLDWQQGLFEPLSTMFSSESWRVERGDGDLNYVCLTRIAPDPESIVPAVSPAKDAKKYVILCGIPS